MPERSDRLEQVRHGFEIVDRQFAPVRITLFQNERQCPLARNTAASTALVVITQPRIARDEDRALRTDGTETRISQNDRPQSIPQPGNPLFHRVAQGPAKAHGVPK